MMKIKEAGRELFQPSQELGEATSDAKHQILPHANCRAAQPLRHLRLNKCANRGRGVAPGIHVFKRALFSRKKNSKQKVLIPPINK